MPSVELDQFISVTYEPDNILLICPCEHSFSAARINGDDWKVMQIKGPYEAEHKDEIKRVCDMLTEKGIAVMVSKNYETDFFLLRQNVAQKAIQVMAESGINIDSTNRKLAI